MTKLLVKAIAQARALPPEEQNMLAEVLLAMTHEGAGAPLDDEGRAAIREGLEQARRGEYVPDAEISALWQSRL